MLLSVTVVRLLLLLLLGTSSPKVSKASTVLLFAPGLLFGESTCRPLMLLSNALKLNDADRLLLVDPYFLLLLAFLFPNSFPQFVFFYY